MLERTFKVKYITSKNCFCYLSDKYSKIIAQGSACKICSENTAYYFSLGDHLFSLKDNEIGLNTAYATTLHLEEGELVTFTQCNNLPGVSNVDICPCNRDDFEILELMAENIQNTLLNQIRIVNNNQKVIVWVSNSISVIVEIDGVKPVSPGCLEFLTEVAIKTPSQKSIKENVKNTHIEWNINNFFKYMKLPSVIQENIIKKYEKYNTFLVFRVYNLEPLKGYVDKHNNFDVYTFKDALPQKAADNTFFTFYPIHLPAESVFFDEAVVNQKNIIVRLRSLERINCKIEDGYFIPIFIDDAILKYYKLTVGAKIVLYPDAVAGNVTKIEILTDTNNIEKTKQQFKLMIAENFTEDGILFNSDIEFNAFNNKKAMLKFTPSNVSAGLVDSNFIRDGEISIIKHEFVEVEEVSIQKKQSDDICLDLANFRGILQGSTTCLSLGLTAFEKLEHILIVGKSGAGKSSIAKAFSKKISSEPYYVHVEIVKCKVIKGKSLDYLHKLFTNTFLKLIYYQPSLLILDDINILCEKVMEGDAVTQESLLFNKISEMLVDLLEEYQENNLVMVLATAESTSSLNQHLFMPRGSHLFKNIFSIDELNKNDRKTFLNFAFTKYKISDNVDLDYLSMKTEGFVVQDMMDFVDKCVFESFKEDLQTINTQHCLNAINTSSSLALKNVELHSPGDRDFSDIGGLEDAKKILVENMMWPVQYTNIFGNSPLRLQSGLLLYGPPGTGKTILAGAAAKQCGLRLISIKGPELLSKYIGASEQAVRDIFQKAQSAKPSILFFDEFDSLAPRRGHDNTGVTDRVVNQFLTQLDGIESLTGVCVLAATSRPDLLDPALLRPGRLDQKILCPLPTYEGRLSILKALSKTLNFADDVNLEKIALKTAEYSGADLQGVLYTAQLTSMEDLLSETQAESDISDSRIEINQSQLEEAVKNTRPSLTREERLKYDRIYAKFEGKLVNDIRAGKQRATLA